jgi:hypothetical protein
VAGAPPDSLDPAARDGDGMRRLGETRGHLSDWVTQRWVRLTGRRVNRSRDPWLVAPTGDACGIGVDFFRHLARREGLEVRAGRAGDEAGLVADFHQLEAPDFDPATLHTDVIDFYTRTSAYELDAWAEWSAPFRPFGRLLARLFSRRLQQLNVPLSGLDTSRGVTSEVLRLVDPATGETRHTAWIRQLVGSGAVLYAGTYSLAPVPRRIGLCVKVAFPLPNGNAIVLMRPEAHPDGSLSLVSAGLTFGDPGFYFTQEERGVLKARYVRALQERITVYAAGGGEVRADHLLRLWGLAFLRLHYRLRPRAARAPSPATLASRGD